MKKTLIVLEGNCGNEGQNYRRWLEENLPSNIELDFRERCSGIGGGLFDDTTGEMEESDAWWEKYCNS